MVLHIDVRLCPTYTPMFKMTTTQGAILLKLSTEIDKAFAPKGLFFVQVCTASARHMQLQRNAVFFVAQHQPDTCSYKGMLFSLLPDEASHMVVQWHQGGQWLCLSGQLLVLTPVIHEPTMVLI